MQKKLQTKGSKKLILTILILALVAIIGYLGFLAKNFFQSKAETHLVKAIEENGYRITYENFTTDNVFAPSQISASNIVLRKIDSSLVVKSTDLNIEFDQAQSKTILKNPEISFTLSGLSKNDDTAWVIKSQDNVTIRHLDDIFDISLPKKSILSSDADASEIQVEFKQDPILIYTYALHEGTGDVVNRSFDLKPNIIAISASHLPTSLSIDSRKVYFNYNNLGFNKVANLELEQVLESYDSDHQIIKDFTTNFDLNVSYKGTLTTGVNNFLKIKGLNIINNSFAVNVTTDLSNSNIDLVPTGVIDINLSNIDFFIKSLYESITSDDIAPQYIRNANFHKIYNMKEDVFTKKFSAFTDYINNKDINSDKFGLTITRKNNAAVFFNQHDLQSTLQKFDEIFFSNKK